MAITKPRAAGAQGDSQERLLVEAAQADPNRFAELYEHNFARVYAFVVRRVRDRNLAEDITSEVFHNALAHLASFDWRGIPFSAWLFRIASNLITDQWKRAAKETVEDPPEAASDVTPEEIERAARLFQMVEALPEEQRKVVFSRFSEGKSIREIAREIGRTEGAVKQLQFRGLQTLRTRLGDQNG
jgi:RNA polymerase sigma-70 factor (ECF subfamily)